MDVAINSTVLFVENSAKAIRNMFGKVEMICRSAGQKQILLSQTIADMKLHSIAQKIIPLIAAILLLLSHSHNVRKRIPMMSLTGVVSAR